MALLTYNSHSCSLLISVVALLLLEVVSGATFTVVNNCDYTVWPGILGKPDLGITGFELPKGGSRSFDAPAGWSGRFWGRTDCNFDDSGRGVCATADCGSGQTECNGAGATPPATLAEFTIGSGSPDYYDVSLVDGYNLPMMVEANGGSGTCTTTGCSADLNRQCPSELRVDGGDACKSACDAFNKPEYCCSGEFNSPSSCKPSMYSDMFKSACPKSYSYAFDDATSTFTCTGADYTITFCPSSRSLKSSTDARQIEQAAVASAAWLAKLATGDSARTEPLGNFKSALILIVAFILSCSYNDVAFLSNRHNESLHAYCKTPLEEIVRF